MPRTGTTPLLAGGTVVLAVAAYLAWRPRMLRWGATPEEAGELLPGDEQTPEPRVQSTRAVTIDAPPEQVWPWLVQMGIGRAGFYTHDRLERLLFRARYVEGRHSATRIHPELQDLRAGDRIDLGGGVHVPVTDVEPFEHLVTFETFVLRRLTGDRTRLLARTRGRGYLEPALDAVSPDAGPLPRLLRSVVRRLPGVHLLARAFDLFVGDPLHHVMDTGMLNGIKQRAEGGSPRTTIEAPAVPVRRPAPGSGRRPAGDPQLADAAGPGGPPPHRVALTAITAVHTLAWFSIETCTVYLLYAGFARRADRRVALAGGVVAGETLLFTANRFRCPLTQLARRLGATRPGVTDIWLPTWFARNLPALHAPLLALVVYLHARNLGRRSSAACTFRRS